MIGIISDCTGNRIKDMRKEKNWTQKQLANMLGLKNDTAIANYETGYSIPKDEIKLKMSKLFNCSIDYLMGISYYKNNTEFQTATKQAIAFLEFSSDETKEMINDILQERTFSIGVLNFYKIEILITDKLLEYRC